MDWLNKEFWQENRELMKTALNDLNRTIAVLSESGQKNDYWNDKQFFLNREIADFTWIKGELAKLYDKLSIVNPQSEIDYEIFEYYAKTSTKIVRRKFSDDEKYIGKARKWCRISQSRSRYKLSKFDNNLASLEKTDMNGWNCWNKYKCREDWSRYVWTECSPSKDFEYFPTAKEAEIAAIEYVCQ